jgi:lipoprotein-releasing system ATP-binding protein
MSNGQIRNPTSDIGNRTMSVEILVRDVWKSFPRDGDRVEVLKGISLRIAPGELVAVVGPSGVGKSTLLHLLGALERPTDGEIFFGQTALSGLSDSALAEFRNREVGFVFQFHHLLPEFTALENVMLPLLIRRQPAARAMARARALLEQVGLGERLRHRPGELSGGEQQRVALARALVGEPAALLADEPTGNLDSKTGDEVFELLRQINRERGLTSIIVTHNETLAGRTGRLLRMLDGRMVE